MWKFLAGLCLVSAQAYAATVELRLPAYSDDSHIYYHELLEQALIEAGHTPVIDVPSSNLPQKRAESMLRNGQLSLVWLLASEERNQDPSLVAINMGLTNGLIGHRLLLVPRSEVDAYRFVRSLEEFRDLNKTGGFGKNWFDVKVWQANQLKTVEVDGEWRRLYKMVANHKRGIDYFSRGFTEIVNDSLQHPYLAIEPYLVLQYQRDFQFYVSSSEPELAPIIEEALKKAEDSGLLDKLIEEYWREDFDLLNYRKRVVIELTTPK
ncbi:MULTISPECIES: hypothetical protein [unclassified Agarivorans]|uniref:hypothetical protein n=1 Tax=unclassified Agarivorans TaxID=2636026 RepID=UPI0010D374D6|nr:MULTISPECIES: hypothetical protein [unclassified Agarivorans]MDO6685672.1 hypothetical protein [Agarivorans sp. 3_MG-2023]MDO6716213.1 hypothetical protein [Agarivorans sp. 2_MG-2023]GDY27326.1 hypothetical protein AHAT_32160 [Agarivorans sp. Toyoura001]